MPDRDAIDEALLRSALRLGPSERPPRLDARAIAARAARRTPGEAALAAFRAAALVGACLGLEAVAVLAIAGAFGELDLTGPLGFGIDLAAAGATALAGLGVAVMSPTLALATLAAVLFATIYERTSGREPVHVHAS